MGYTGEKKREYDRRRYAENAVCREKAKSRAKVYREKNLDKCKAANKEYRTENKEKIRASVKSWHEKNPDYQRNYNIKRYGINQAQYENMVDAQCGVCAICGNPPDGKGNTGHCLNIDHNHVTQKIRALLCSNCNTALGKFKDSPELLEKAAAYLRRHGK